MPQVIVGSRIGLIQKILSDGKGRKNYWKLTEGKVKSITVNSKGRRVKAEHFYTLDAYDIEFNTKWLLENDNIVLVCEPFILTDELRERVDRWINYENSLEQEAIQ